jgi:hypothetical protein
MKLWGIFIFLSLLGQPAPAEELFNQVENSLLTRAMINHQAIGTFILDTGSTYATISPEMAKLLKVEVTEDTPRVTITTAEGQRTLPRVTLRSISVEGVEVKNVPALVMPIPEDPMLCGLLGMSYLGRVNVAIRHGQVTISK